MDFVLISPRDLPIVPEMDGIMMPARIAILKRMADSIWVFNPNAYIILEHFTDGNEEKELANYGCMIWGNHNCNYNQSTMGWIPSGPCELGFYRNII